MWVQIIYAMSHITYYFSLCPHHVTFYKTLTSLPTVFIKAHVGLLHLLKWSCCTSFFTHVEPYVGGWDIPVYNSTVRNLGVMNDPELSMASHINHLCQFLHYHLRNIGEVHCHLSRSSTRQLIN